MDTAVQETLGVALRRWRDRLSPHDVGLPARNVRRAAGLRREELADLAGLSVDYVVRLEQGRATNPSAQVVGTLARALQLQTLERDHLFRLAGLLPPADGTISTLLPPGVARLVGRLSEQPVAVFSADWTMLTWSPSWAVVLGDPGEVPAAHRNLVRSAFALSRYRLASTPVRYESPDGAEEMLRALVADLRSASVTYPRDTGLARLVAEARSGSAEFARLWDTGAVGVHTSARKTVVHPVVGDVEVDCDVLTAPGSDVKLVVYSAATGSRAAQALEFLRVSGVATSTPATVPPTRS